MSRDEPQNAKHEEQPDPFALMPSPNRPGDVVKRGWKPCIYVLRLLPLDGGLLVLSPCYPKVIFVQSRSFLRTRL